MRRCNYFLTILFFICGNLFAQNAAQVNQSTQVNQNAPVAPVTPVSPIAPVPQVSGIEMPKMPAISSSINSNEMYRPGNKTQNSKTQNHSQTEPAAEQTEKNQNSNSIETYIKQISGLSAKDIAALSQQGLFSNFSDLLGGNFSLPNSTSQNQNLLLNQILKELEEIKKNQAQLNSIVNASDSQKNNSASKILRFVIDGQNLLPSCTSIYFSRIENDGSFFLTGDCKTLFQNIPLSETFYMLFKTAGTQNGKIIYTVELSILQNENHPDSKLCKLCSQPDITAVRTGNLVKLSRADGDFSYELLIDIGQ